MPADLSKHAKETFQIVGLLATVMVVGIHYKSDVPDSPGLGDATWNELLQEFWLGGVARVAVPMFAFTAGLFYFRSDDGTFRCYRRKLSQRCRSIAFPYFIVASVAMTSWLLIRRMRSEWLDLQPADFLSSWLLRPPAEQLWFLRDLMVLVLIAPLIRWLVQTKPRRYVTVSAVIVAWMLNWQPTPIVAGWHLIHVETLAFFTLGAVAAKRLDLVTRATQWSLRTGFLLSIAWLGLVALRVCSRADFDIWYRNDYSLPDLLLHQSSILVGCLALLNLAAHANIATLRCWSGAAFFVFLIHEFPLRALVRSVADTIVGPSMACWICFPAVVVGCFAFALWTSRRLPSVFAMVTGGRTPTRAACLASTGSIAAENIAAENTADATSLTTRGGTP